jgi:chloramphenicol-sensitive protein RarD
MNQSKDPGPSRGLLRYPKADLNSAQRLTRGLTVGVLAYLIWGSFPLIISMLGFASPFEIVVWRIVFGFLVAAALITFTKGWSDLVAVVKQPKLMVWVLASSVFIMANWQIYVVAISEHHVVESALGYFINPLITILLAVVFLRERLRKLQWAAVAMGAVAVTVLTIDYGRLPWIALSLAGSFAIYGLAKSKLGGKVSAINSYALESGILLPVAAIQGSIIGSMAPGLQFGQHGFWGAAGLIFFGVMTAIPLILFGTAAKYLPLSYIGLLQYMTPTIQFILALAVFHEDMPIARWLGFILVWTALGFLTTDMLRHARNRQKTAN